MPLLTTGLSGLVGSKLAQSYQDKYDFINLDTAHPIHPTDITDLDQVKWAVSHSSAEFIIHFAAFTDVNKAWQDRDNKSGLTYQVNVGGTDNLVKAASEMNHHLIHISTAFVFDGDKPNLYQETDQPHPIEWYGQTKAWAEEIVQSADCPWTILRIDFPFRSDPFPRPDIVRKTLTAVDQGLPLFSNHFFGPTFIDDFVKVIDWVIRTKTRGLFHASSGESWSDYQLGQAIMTTLHRQNQIKSADLNQYLETSDRPYQRNTALDCSKLISMLDFPLTTINRALKLVNFDHEKSSS